MPKMKTHKGLKKRIKVTANGKVNHKHPNAGHLMSHKNGNRRRNMRRAGFIAGNLGKIMRAAVGRE